MIVVRWLCDPRDDIFSYESKKRGKKRKEGIVSSLFNVLQRNKISFIFVSERRAAVFPCVCCVCARLVMLKPAHLDTPNRP